MTKKEFLEIVCTILCALMFVVLFWLYMIVTPDQCSAECDALREEMKEMGYVEP